MSVDLILLKEWGMVFAVFPLLLLPGLGPAQALVRRQKLSLAWLLLLAAGFTFAVDALIEMLAYYVGAGFTMVLWGHVLAMIVSGVWFIRQRHKPSTFEKVGLSGMALAFIAACAALLQEPWWVGDPDTYHHLAAARSLLATNAPLVTDPFFGTGSTLIDAASGSLHPVMAVISRLTATDMATGYAALTAFGAAFMVLGFWVFAQEVLSSRRAADLSTILYVIGVWFTDFRAFAYPNRLSLGLAFVAMALIVRLARGTSRDIFIASGAIGFATVSMHLGSAELVLLVGVAIGFGILVFGLIERGDARRSHIRAGGRVLAALTLIAVSAAPVLYPRIVSLQGTSVLGSDSFRNATEEILRLPFGLRVVEPGGFGFGGGTIFWVTLALALLILGRSMKTRRSDDIALASVLLVFPAITLFPPISTVALGVSSYMVARMVVLLRFVTYLALAWPIAVLVDGRRRFALGLGALVLTVVIAAPYLTSTYIQGAGLPRIGQSRSIPFAKANDVRASFGRDVIGAVRDAAGDDYPCVLASQMSGYHLMGLSTVTVVASLPAHSPVFMPAKEAQTRRDDVDRFFEAGATPAERARIADAYDAEYVFVSDVFDKRPVRDELAEQNAFLEPVYVGKRASLFRIVR